MTGELATMPRGTTAARHVAADEPGWALRIEEQTVSVVLQGAELPLGAELTELAIRLPHVAFPVDFREGLERFRHHRGRADVVEIAIDARLLLEWLRRRSSGRVTGRAVGDTLVLLGRTDEGIRYTLRARVVPDPDGGPSGGVLPSSEAASEGEGDEGSDGPPPGAGREPALLVSAFDVRAYGPVDEPWPLLASRVLDLLPPELVVERTPTTARLRLVRPAIVPALAEHGWKLPETAGLAAHGVELRDGRLTARFVAEDAAESGVVTLDAVRDPGGRAGFERFVEDLDLKRHHGDIDRLLARGALREALAEAWRGLGGAPRPGFLTDRIIGICASQPILYDEGERVCHELLRQSPEYAPALCGLASIAMGRSDRERAAIHLERLAGALGASGEAGRAPNGGAAGPGLPAGAGGGGASWTDAGLRTPIAQEHLEDATACDLALAELLRDRDPAESEAALDRVLERAPDHEEALEERIALAEARGDVEATVPLYKRLLFSARSPQRTREAGLRLARHALGRREPEEARVFLRVVLEHAPHDAEARVALADVEAAEGRTDQAASALERALRILPPSASGSLARVVGRLADLALDTLGEPLRARRALWRALDVPELSAEDALALAERAMRAEEPELTLRYAERAAADPRRWAAARRLQARAELARGRREAALNAVLAVLEAEPADEEALELLEATAAEVEVRERLLLRLRRAAAAATDPAARARLHRALARIYESLDLYADAVSPWEAALDDGRGQGVDREVAERLLSLYEHYGMWPRHLELCRQLLGQLDDPVERVPVLLRYGRTALRELDDAETARRALAEAAELAPRRVEVLEALREALTRQGDLDELIPVLRRLETVHPDASRREGYAVRLAELLLERQSAVGEARAVLQRLPAPRRRDRDVAALARRVGLDEGAPRATGAPARAEPPERGGSALGRPEPPHSEADVGDEAGAGEAGGGSRVDDDRYVRALRLADEGRREEAVGELDELLREEPDHVPARELAELLVEATMQDEDVGELGTDPLGGAMDDELPPDVAGAVAEPPLEPSEAKGGSTASTGNAPGGPGEPDAVPPSGAPAEAPTRQIGRAAPPEPVRGSDAEGAAGASEDGERGGAAPGDEAEREEADEALPAPVESELARSRRAEELLERARERAEADAVEEAQELLDEVLGLDPELVDALELRAELLSEQGRWSVLAETLEGLEELVFDAQRAESCLRERARILAEHLDDGAGAAACWERLLVWRPLDQEAYERLVAHHSSQGDLEGVARIWARRAEAARRGAEEGRSPSTCQRIEADARCEEARVRLHEVGDPEGALAAAESGLATAPDEPELLELLARARAETGDREGGRRAAERLLPQLLEGPLAEEMRRLAER